LHLHANSERCFLIRAVCRRSVRRKPAEPSPAQSSHVVRTVQSRVDVGEHGAAVAGRVVGQRRSAGGTARRRPETGGPRPVHQRPDRRRDARGRARRRRPYRRLPSVAVRPVQTDHFGHVESERTYKYCRVVGAATAF